MGSLISAPSICCLMSHHIRSFVWFVAATFYQIIAHRMACPPSKEARGVFRPIATRSRCWCVSADRKILRGCLTWVHLRELPFNRGPTRVRPVASAQVSSSSPRELLPERRFVWTSPHLFGDLMWNEPTGRGNTSSFNVRRCRVEARQLVLSLPDVRKRLSSTCDETRR